MASKTFTATQPSRAELLEKLIRCFVSGQPLPKTIGGEAGALPLADWLETFRFDQSEFSATDLASRLDLQTIPPLMCEAALTIRARLA